jgi:hypothetical protein
MAVGGPGVCDRAAEAEVERMWCAANRDNGECDDELKGGADVGEVARGDVDGGLVTGVEVCMRVYWASSAEVGSEPAPSVPAATLIFSLFISARSVWHS